MTHAPRRAVAEHTQRTRCPIAFAFGLALLFGCGDDDNAPTDAGADASTPTDAGVDAPPVDANQDGLDPGDPSVFVDAAAYEYDWTCSGEVAATATPLEAEPPEEACVDEAGEPAGIWPNLDLRFVCPTVSDTTRVDPDTGMSLPPEDTRTLPLEIPVSESGSFLPADLPDTWPSTLRVVAWNMEYSRNLDAQIETLTTHPDLRDADVYLLSEVDRCSSRNGMRRAARELARRIEGQYVYGIEFVELSIDRTVGGDTGQAIVSRRPLTGASLTCHSRQNDWFADDGEPRLGQRVALHADLPAGDTQVRVWAVHLESNDIFGELRAVQSKELLDASQALACDRPQVVAGDFNAWFRRAPELVVLKDNGFTDTLAVLGDDDSTHDSGRRLDYIFARGLSATGGAVLRDVDTSDHYPMWTTLTVD